MPFRVVIPLLLLIVGCSGTVREVPLVDGDVDRVEDGDLRNRIGHPWEAISAGTGATATVSLGPGGYQADSRYHVVLLGSRTASGSDISGLRTAITQLPPAADPTSEPRPRDVTAFDGIELALRGLPGSYIVQLGQANITDFDYHNAYVEAGPEWSLFRLPFDVFRQEGFGERQPWTGRDVVHIAVFSNREGRIDFGVDDVRFFKN
jgi:hypothetical protein